MRTRRHTRKPEKERAIAVGRIENLFRAAESRATDRPDLAKRYVTLARKIAMKYKVRIKSHFKRRFCKACHAFFVPGANLRIRISDGKVTYQCLACKAYMRFPYDGQGKILR